MVAPVYAGSSEYGMTMEDRADTIEQETRTKKIAGVRFRENWKVYDFDATDIDVAVGDRVIVDSERGPGFAHVVRIRRTQVPAVEAPPVASAPPPEIPDGVEIDIDDVGKEPQAAAPSAPSHARGVRRILRKATEDDFAREEKNREREKEAFLAGQDMIAERELPMRLVRVEYSFDASRATFFFFSETRIDFRELVKDLAHKLKSRIEMRQIGVRDVARMIGGFGPCGRELCCSSFLKNFEPVSIRMAKKQEMVLNPAKISGVCGRLLCCLSYEYEMYDEIKKDLAGMNQAAIKEKRDKEEQRIAEERRDAEERRLADEKKRQEERRHQEPRREKRAEGGQKSGGRPEKGREQQERKAQAKSERTREQAQGKQQEQKAKQQEQRARQPEQKAGQPEQKTEQPQPQQQPGEKAGKKKRRRFWRKKKKGQSGENKPQGPAGPQNQG
jgi:cell fate regulator YaaT (PSP1 superfamily)